MSYWTKSFMMLGKLQRAHPTLHGHFAPAYLVGNNKFRAYIFSIYDWRQKKTNSFQIFTKLRYQNFSSLLLSVYKVWVKLTIGFLFTTTRHDTHLPISVLSFTNWQKERNIFSSQKIGHSFQGYKVQVWSLPQLRILKLKSMYTDHPPIASQFSTSTPLHPNLYVRTKTCDTLTLTLLIIYICNYEIFLCM